MIALTKRQREIVSIIESFHSRKGFSPSMREIAEELGSISVSAVFNHLAALERKAFISRDRKTARSIKINNPSLQTR